MQWWVWTRKQCWLAIALRSICREDVEIKILLLLVGHHCSLLVGQDCSSDILSKKV